MRCMPAAFRKGQAPLRSLHEQYEVEIWQELEPIRARWDALERTGVSTPFQSYAWISALLDTVGRSLGAEPHTAIVKDRNSGEDLMLLPLVRSRRRLLHFVEIPDFGASDYNSPIVSRTIASDHRRVAESWDAAMRALPAGDVLHISKVPEVVSHAPNPFLRLQRVRTEVYSSWQIALPENLSELEQSLSSSTRRQIRRRTRQLETAGPLQYVVPSSGAEAKALFDVLRQQRQPRFAALGRYDILASAPHRTFYNRIVESGYDNGVAAVHALQVGDETVATAFGLQWQKRFHLLMTSMAGGRWLENSPGMVMIWKLITHMHAKGCRTFDFTIGDEPYKRHFGATECTLSEYFRALSPMGRPYTAGLWLRPALVAAKRKLVKTQSERSTERPAPPAGVKGTV
jgi:CelD/BcsL family acetyltransferase involved in cellulose biosynthesis